MKWVNGGEGTALPFSGIPLISVERKMKTTTSHNYFKQESSTDDKTSGQNVIKKYILKVSHYKILIHYKGKK